MFGNRLMISVQAALEQTLSLHLLPTKMNSQPVYIQTGALVLYKQTALVARGLIRRRPTNPIKSPFFPRAVCLKTGRVTRKEGGDWQSDVVVSVPTSVYVLTAKHRYHSAVRSRSLPVMWAGTKAECLPGEPKNIQIINRNRTLYSV